MFNYVVRWDIYIWSCFQYQVSSEIINDIDLYAHKKKAHDYQKYIWKIFIHL